MSILAAENPVQISTPAAGSTTLGPWSSVFSAYENADVLVYVREADGTLHLLDEGGDYTLAAVGVDIKTYNVTLTALPLGWSSWPGDADLIRVRATDLTQLYDLNPSIAINQTAMKRALDRLTRIVQENQAELGRAAKGRYGETGPTLPKQADRAGTLAVWSDDGATLRTDRTLTQFDADVQSAADNKDAAVAAKNAAVAAQGAAEDAQGASEDARDESKAARDDARDAADRAASVMSTALKDRGAFTPAAASGATGYPTTGGSGDAGAIKAGDRFTADADGYVLTQPVARGFRVLAKVDDPGQTAANWIADDLGNSLYDPGFPGITVPMPYVNLIRDELNLLQCGARAGDLIDNTVAMSTFFGALANDAYLFRGIIPPGRFRFDAQSIILSKDIELRASRFTELMYANTSATPLIHIDGSYLYGADWEGGIIDPKDGTFVAAAQSNTCIDPVRLVNFTFRKIFFRGQPTWEQAIVEGVGGVDSGLTPTSCLRGTIDTCWFLGMGDVGIYMTGGSTANDYTDDGGDIIVTNSHFRECNQVGSVKREMGRTIWTTGSAEDCYAGITTLNTTGIKPGRALTISDFVFKKTVTRAIEIRQGTKTLISGVRIEDFGYSDNGVTPSDNPNAIRLLGAESVDIRDTDIYNQEWAKHATHVGIDIENLTTDLGTFTSQKHTIKNCRIAGVTKGIFEAAGVGKSSYERNAIESTVDTPYTIASGSNSRVIQTDTGDVQTTYANVGNAGAAETTLHSMTIPAKTLNRDGRHIRIVASGTAGNNANAKTLKFYFGTTVCLTTSLTINASDRWVAIIDITRTGSSSQKISVALSEGPSGQDDVEYTTPTEDDTADILVKFTGQATNSNEILQNLMTMEILN